MADFRRRSASSRGVSDRELDRLIGSQPWDCLDESLKEAGADPATVVPKLRAFAREIVSWNRSVSNLISRNDEPRIVARHFLESLRPARWLGQTGVSHWLDLGSGAGLPAIPLALAGIGTSWTMVESRRPKVLFLRKMIQILELRSMEVVHSRFETAELAERVDGFTARAVQDLPSVLDLAKSSVVSGGHAFLWKGSRWKEEMEGDRGWEAAWSFEDSLSLGGDEQASVLHFTRRGP